MTTVSLDAWKERAPFLKKIQLDKAQTIVAKELAEGALAPLTGYQLRRDYESVRDNGTLADGTAFDRAVSLQLPEEVGCQYQIADDVTLVADSGEVLGVFHIEDKWLPDPSNPSVLAFGGAVVFF